MSKGDAMKADELREMLDRFRALLDEGDQDALSGARKRAALHRVAVANEPRPPWLIGLDKIWRDLDRQCAMMKDAERRDGVTTLRQRLSHVEGNPEWIKTLDFGDGSVPG